MNFDLSEEQQVVSDLAAKLIGDLATTERVKAAEAADGLDRDLWRELAGSGLLGLCLPESVGGGGMGMVELALIATQQGRNVAPVPLVPTVVTAAALAEFAEIDGQAELLSGVIAGEHILTVALAEAGANAVDAPAALATVADGGFHLSGWQPSVPAAQHASLIVVPTTLDGEIVLFAVDADAPGVAIEPIASTDRRPAGHVTLDVTVSGDRRFGDAAALAWLTQRMIVAQCAVQLGVAEGSLKLTAEYVSSREQFGRPLATFQAVGQRAADAYIATEALRVTTLSAAWRLDEGAKADEDVLVAAWWAAEGGQQIVLAGQHLHGGIGADIDYPVHRYFLWGSQLANSLGTASSHLARLGQLIARPEGERS